MAAVLQGMGWEMPEDTMNLQYVPGEEDLDNLKEVGKRLAGAVKTVT